MGCDDVCRVRVHVLKPRHPSDSAFCTGFFLRLEVPEQALGGIPLLVVEDIPTDFSCEIV